MKTFADTFLVVCAVIVLLMSVAFGIFILVDGSANRNKECWEYANTTINFTPVRCFKEFGIE